MQQLLSLIEQRMVYFGRRAGISIFAGLVGAVLLLAGIGFLASALWMFLVTELGEMTASILCGIVLLCLGTLAFLLGTLKRRVPPPPPVSPVYGSAQNVGVVAILEAFITGMRAARGRNVSGSTPGE